MAHSDSLSGSSWRAEMNAISLSRLRWLWGVSAVLVAAFLGAVALVPALQGHGFADRTLVDVAVVAIFLAWGTWARRQPIASPWADMYVWASVVVTLTSTMAWYFEGLARWGQTSDYSIGVVAVSALILEPPPQMIGVLAANHAVFCAILLSSGHSQTDIITGLIDNSFSVVIAAVVSGLVYRARFAEFVKAQALEAANSELREMTALAAHDLRSPLLGLRDLLDMARARRTDGDADSRVLALARDSCEALVRLATRLLDAHVASEAPGTLRLDRCDLREACAASVERFRATALTKRQQVALAVPEAPAIARIDRTAFGQVVDNLLGNALKFSPHGSAVECRVYADGDRWCVDVCDEGPSIPVEERRRLFRKFHRGAARPTGGESSTGLGLYIAHALAEAMEGRLTHVPRDPAGSVFRVELPAAR